MPHPLLTLEGHLTISCPSNGYVAAKLDESVMMWDRQPPRTASSHHSKRKNQLFYEEWEIVYNWVRSVKGDSQKASCEVCPSYISTSHEGEHDLKWKCRSDLHKKHTSESCLSIYGHTLTQTQRPQPDRCGNSSRDHQSLPPGAALSPTGQ